MSASKLGIKTSVCLALGLVFVAQVSGAAESVKESEISWNQKVGSQIQPEIVAAPFTDESGKSVLLKDFLMTGKPTILTLVYFGCPNLCTLVLNGLVQAVSDLQKTTDLKIGRDFNLVSATIDTHETYRLALAKQRSYLARLDLDSTTQAGDWHFLSSNKADPTAVESLADAVGFRYRYDPVSEQYVHPSGLVVIDSDGKIIQYLTGIQFKSSDLQEALISAQKKRSGSVVEDLVLICSHYNPFSTANTRRVVIGIQIFSGLFVVGFLGTGLWYSLRRRSVLS